MRHLRLEPSLRAAAAAAAATVAAKTKAAREIISLKSSSKLHPGRPMAAGPGIVLQF